jgi:hypothetical protein
MHCFFVYGACSFFPSFANNEMRKQQGGVESTLTNLRKPPETYLWGEAKRIFPNHDGGAVAIRGDMNANEPEVVDWDLRVNGFRNAVGLRLLGSAGTYNTLVHSIATMHGFFYRFVD